MPKRDWKDPYFKYEVGKRKTEIIIDVTGSIPRFQKEVDALRDVAAEFRERGFTTILDFGAGRL